MREILFRGKRIDNGEWVSSGNIIRFNAENGEDLVFIPELNEPCICDHDEKDNIIAFEKGMFYKVDTKTVGQYTGLKDKNGKRVFEGDVIKRFWLGAEIIYCVQYDGENAHFIGKAMNKSGFTTFDGDGEMFEVIGNITDNPELLEK